MPQVADGAAGVPRLVRQAGAADGDLAGVGAQEGRDHAEQGALARTVRPEHGEAFARRQVHVHAVHGAALAEPPHQPARADQLALRYSVTSASVKARNTMDRTPFDWAKATWMREVSPGRTMAFS